MYDREWILLVLIIISVYIHMVEYIGSISHWNFYYDVV